MSDKEVRKEAGYKQAFGCPECAAWFVPPKDLWAGFEGSRPSCPCCNTLMQREDKNPVRAALSRGPLLLSFETLLAVMDTTFRDRAKCVHDYRDAQTLCAAILAAQGAELRAVLEARLTDGIIAGAVDTAFDSDGEELTCDVDHIRRIILDALTESGGES